jgi:hypothetical protein
MAGRGKRGPDPGLTDLDRAVTKLLRLTESAGPLAAAREWSAGLALEEAQALASAWALAVARRHAAQLAEVAELDDGGAA